MSQLLLSPLSVYNLTARPLVTYWSNTEKVFAGNEFEPKIHVLVR